MLKKTSLVLLLVAMLTLFAVPAAFAQETFGLTAEDFALWTGANAASSAQSELTFEFTTDITIDDGMDAVTANVTGNGIIGLDAGALYMDIAVPDAGNIPLALLFVNDTVYLDLTAAGAGWISITESDLEALNNLDPAAAGLPFDPQEFLNDPTSALPEEAMNDIFAGLGTFDPTTLISISREADTEGYPTFYASFDMAALAATDIFKSAVAAGIAQDGSVSYEDAKLQADGVVAMLAPFFDNSEVSLTQYIEPASNLVEEAFVVLYFGGEGAPATIDLGVSVIINSYTADTSGIVAPEGATPLSTLLTAFAG